MVSKWWRKVIEVPQFHWHRTNMDKLQENHGDLYTWNLHGINHGINHGIKSPKKCNKDWKGCFSQGRPAKIRSEPSASSRMHRSMSISAMARHFSEVPTAPVSIFTKLNTSPNSAWLDWPLTVMGLNMFCQHGSKKIKKWKWHEPKNCLRSLISIDIHSNWAGSKQKLSKISRPAWSLDNDNPIFQLHVDTSPHQHRDVGSWCCYQAARESCLFQGGLVLGRGKQKC